MRSSHVVWLEHLTANAKVAKVPQS
jgi:hypothetical protein